MMSAIETLSAKVNERFANLIQRSHLAIGELTIEVSPHHLREVCFALRDEADFEFNQLIDVCGVDYLQYGISQWETVSTTETGFERGVVVDAFNSPDSPPPELPHVGPYFKATGVPGELSHSHRFASVYHLLSLSKNQRIRLKVFLDAVHPLVPSVVDIWPSANWFERESFDLFGIHYADHPDLRRILTDYGFIGHPFRKDFPLIGNVEARYDAKLKQVVYGPVSIEARVLEPKVIRKDHRYEVGGES